MLLTTIDNLFNIDNLCFPNLNSAIKTMKFEIIHTLVTLNNLKVEIKNSPSDWTLIIIRNL